MMSFCIIAALLNYHNKPPMAEIHGEDSLLPNKHVVAVKRIRFIAQVNHIMLMVIS